MRARSVTASRTFGAPSWVMLAGALAVAACSRRASAPAPTASAASAPPAATSFASAQPMASAASSGSAALSAVAAMPVIPPPPEAVPKSSFRGAPVEAGLRSELVPGPSAGWVDALVATEGSVFVGTSGVFRSDDRGAHFRRASNGLPRVGDKTLPAAGQSRALGSYGRIPALAVDHGVLLAGTPYAQVFRSTDRGESWALASGLPDIGERISGFATVKSIVVLPDKVFAEIQGRGVYRSTDAGQSFALLKREQSSALAEATSLIVEQGVLYALARGGVLVSDDGGEHERVVKLAHEPKALLGRNGVVYVSFTDDDVPSYESRDRGRSFHETPIGDTPWKTTAFVHLGLALAEPDAEHASLVRTLLSNTQAALELGGDRLLFGTTSGLFVSNDRGKTASLPDAGLTTEGFGRVGVTTSRLFTVTQRTKDGLGGRVCASGLAAPSFRNVSAGFSGVTAFDARGAEVFLGDDQGRLFRSTDEGQTFTQLALPRATPGGPVSALAVRGRDRLVVRGGILLSHDEGQTFKDLRAGFPIEPTEFPVGEYSYDLGGALLTERSILIAAGSRVVRRAEGRGWSAIALPGYGGTVIGLAADGDRVYAATGSMLFVSTDDGASFRALSDTGGETIVGIGAERGELFVVTRYGDMAVEHLSLRCVLSRDQGTTWRVVADRRGLAPLSAPVAGAEGWYTGLETDGIWYVKTRRGE